jgi:predicted nucleic acid-binding protein
VKLFLDANILFTAAYSERGISRTLFRLAGAGRCSLITSAYAADEARRNLAVKAPTALPEFGKLLETAALVREPAPAVIARMKKLPLTEKDAPIMAAAVEYGADILVTGDRRDFGHLFGLEVEGVLVLNPADTLDRVMSEVKR